MSRGTGSFLIAVMLVLGRPPAEVVGDEVKESAKTNAFVTRSLASEIIGPRQTLVESISECESMIPSMPEVKSVKEWEKVADQMRSDAFAHVIFRGEAAAWRAAQGKVEWLETIAGGPGYRIKKLRYEALPGLWIPALLYEPEVITGKVPVVLNVNGHDANGKAADYKQIRCVNLARRGMIALNLEWFGMGQFRDGNSRHDLINHIDLCGTSGIATHYLAMSRALDLLLALEHADASRVAVTGLSGGGWQTIFLSAFDRRVTLVNPVAGYSSFRTRTRFFSDLGDSEQTPCDLATVTDYAQMTAMLAPRAALLTFNARDNCCFATGHALPPLLEAAAPIYQLYGKESQLRTHVNEDPGTHNYLRDNREAFYRMVGETFFQADHSYDASEIPSDGEVKSVETLHVSLPDDNQSLHRLALDLSRSLPRNGDFPVEKAEARVWRDERRKRLRDVVRSRRFETTARPIGRVSGEDGIQVISWRLQVGDWSVPVVEMAKGDPGRTLILVSDEGRKASAEAATWWIGENYRVLAVDPFLIGEAKVAEREELFALLIAAVGERPLGVQAGQLAAVARWAKSQRPNAPLTLASIGPRTSAMVLTAANLEEAAIDELVLTRPLGSFKELIESKQEYRRSPELFCFGLLENFDIAQLAAMIAPRRVLIRELNERARQETQRLGDWYRTWGMEWNPTR